MKENRSQNQSQRADQKEQKTNIHVTDARKENSTKYLTICQQIERVVEDMCNNYCKWPTQPIPEGKTEDWLLEDEDSPCENCPLNQLR